MHSALRRRSADEIFQIIKGRKWLIGLPALAVLMSVAYVVYRLPNVYESTTLLSITPPKISEKVAPSLTDADVSQRLQAIGQIVLSRTSLEPLIIQHDLYAKERRTGVPMEQLVDSFKKSILVDLESGENNTVVGFRITYRGTNAKTVQNVVSTIADKYVTAQLTESMLSAETTKVFIDDQILQAKTQLDALDKQRLDIMSRNIESLPESGAGLIAQLQGLRQSEQTLSKDKESLIVEHGRTQESIRSINNQISLITSFGERETQEALTQATRIEDTPAYAQLVQKRAELNAKLENLRLQYREKSPQIVEIQNEIKGVNDEIEKLSQNTDKRVRSATQSSERKAELQRRSLEIEKEKAENTLQILTQQILSKENVLRQNFEQIGQIESRINSIPSVKVELEGINNQYVSAKATYDDLLKKYNSAQQQVDRESNKQGETIKIVDPANFPLAAVNASKKPLFYLAGLGLGLAVGLLLAASVEVPRFFRLQSPDDVEYYTGVRVLAAIPQIRNDAELTKERQWRLVRVAGGVLLMIVSVPVLIVAFETTNLFARFS